YKRVSRVVVPRVALPIELALTVVYVAWVVTPAHLLDVEVVALACVDVPRVEIHAHLLARRGDEAATRERDELLGQMWDNPSWNRVARGCDLATKTPIKPARVVFDGPKWCNE